MSNEKQIEQEIQEKGLDAPRLTPDHIDSVIVDKYFFTAANAQWGADPNTTALIGMHKQLETLTFCVLILKKTASLLQVSQRAQVLKTSILKLVKKLPTKMHEIRFGNWKVTC